ncbi:MAG: hypothetical protein ACREK5_09480, partial [Gemmatimonadota bacterium]
MMRATTWMTVLTVTASILWGGACREGDGEGDLEIGGDTLQIGIEDDDLDEAGRDARGAIEEAAEETGQAVGEAVEETGQAIGDAAEETDGPGTDRFRHPAEQVGQLVVALDGDGRPVERRDRPLRVGEGDEGVERADLGPRRHRRGEGLRPEQAARVDHRLAAVHPDLASERLDRIVRH